MHTEPPHPPHPAPAQPNRPAETPIPSGELEAPVTTWTDRTADRPLSLSAPSGIDRAANHRLDEAWLAAAWSHPTTRVFVVSGGQVLIDETPDGATELVMTPSFEAPLTEAHRYFLGTDDDGVSYFALQKDTLPGRIDQSARPAGLREAGLLLSPGQQASWCTPSPSRTGSACTASAPAAANAPSSPPRATSAAARPAEPSTTPAPTPQ